VIIDTSAILAILRDEPDAAALAGRLLDDRCAMAAPTLVELAIVTEGRGGAALRLEAEALLARARIEVVAFTAEHARLAMEGWRRYGRGRHAAGLNLGDCFAYALAQSRGEPLLFKGDDFRHTDVKAAL
jgi:ribonuclease VapC